MTEQEIITRYDKLLWKHVHNFKNRCTGRTIPDEDLIQTARMAFLQFVRKHDPQDWHKCGLTILHALCDEVQRYCPLKMARSTYLSKEKREGIHSTAFDECGEIEKEQDEQKELEVLLEIMDIAEGISKDCKALVELRLRGHTNAQAARLLGKSAPWASVTLNKLHRLYEE